MGFKHTVSLWLIAFLVIGSLFQSSSHGGSSRLAEGSIRLSNSRRTLLVGLAVANVTNAHELIAAFANPAVELILVKAPLVDVPVEAWSASGFELPIVLTRNVSLEGDQFEWPLLRLHYVRDVLRLAGNVTWTIRFLVVDGTFSDNVSRESGFQVLSPTLPNQTSAVWIGPAATTFRFCIPISEYITYRLNDAVTRPASLPGDQRLNFSVSQVGCANGSEVPPLRRCWPRTVLIGDVAGDGSRLDASDISVPINIVFWMRNVTGLCEIIVDQDCIQRRVEPLVCFKETVRRYQSVVGSVLDDYQPPAGLQQQHPQQQHPLREQEQQQPYLREWPAGSVAAAAAGAVVVVLLLTAATVAAVVWARRRRGGAIPCLCFGRQSSAVAKRTCSSAEVRPLPPPPPPAPSRASFSICRCLSPDDVSTDCTTTAADVEASGLSDWRLLPPSRQQDTYTQGQVEDGCVRNGMGTTTTAGSVVARPMLDAPVTLETEPRATLNLHVRLLETTESSSSSIGSGNVMAVASALGDEQQQAEEDAAASWVMSISLQEEIITARGREDQPSAGSSKSHSTSPTDALIANNSDGRSINDVGGGIAGGGVVQLLPVVRGKGAFGRVVEGMYGNRRVAVKLLSGDGPWGPSSEALAKSFAQEVQVLSRCRHPNVVRLLAACVDAPRLCLVLELMETSLEGLIHGRGVRELHNGRFMGKKLIPLPKVLRIAISVASALSYLHPTIVHRDLKPANVLVSDPKSDRPIVKLSDFGLSRLRVTAAPTEHPDAGTPPYMAPECFDLANQTVTHKADVYSLGVLLWEMISGLVPWAGLKPVVIGLLVSYKRERLSLTDLDKSRCPPKLVRLIEACWEADPCRRPAAAELVKELTLVLQQDVEQQQQQRKQEQELPEQRQQQQP